MKTEDWLRTNLKNLQTNPVARFLASLRLAVVGMGSLATVLAAGTFVESRYNADMARLVLYDQWYFRVVLVLLFLNILMAVVVRLPLRRDQYPFGCIHLGMLTLLVGAFTTQMGGLDGTMEIPEGSASMAVRMPETVLRSYVNEQLAAESRIHRSLWSSRGDLGPVPGMPAPEPRILESIPFSKTYQRVVSDSQGGPMVELALLTGGPEPTTMRLGLDNPLASPREDLGLMAVSLERATSAASFLDTSSSSPAAFRLVARAGRDSIGLSLADLVQQGRKRSGSLEVEVLEFLPDAQIGENGLANRSDHLNNPAARLRVARGDSAWEEILYGRVPEFRFSGDRHPEVAWKVDFHPAGGASATPLLRLGFAGDTLMARCEKDGRILSAFRLPLGKDLALPFGVLHMSVGAWEPRGNLRDSCVGIDPAPGKDLPPPAIRVGEGPWGAPRWIPLGGVFTWNEHGLRRALSYEGRRVALPFGIRLDRFRIGTDPGTSQAASYESFVTVVDSAGMPADSARIAMNEPLKKAGFTFYQASFAQEAGRSSTTILSVNRDPGRAIKYFGALLTIFSIAWYTLERSHIRRREKTA
jgi:hypothetical protein